MKKAATATNPRANFMRLTCKFREKTRFKSQFCKVLWFHTIWFGSGEITDGITCLLLITFLCVVVFQCKILTKRNPGWRVMWSKLQGKYITQLTADLSFIINVRTAVNQNDYFSNWSNLSSALSFLNLFQNIISIGISF